MKTTTVDKWLYVLVMIVICGVVALMLNWLVFPIVYLIIHDCGRFMCDHYFEFTWTSFLITTAVLFIMLSVLMYLSQKSIDNKQQSPNNHRPTANNKRQGGAGRRPLETDYYDEDMEGAPGYYGGEE